MSTVDTNAVESKVKSMYERVAHDPHGEFHFEMGRDMAERLGYSSYDLDRVPAPSIDSFAGVGHHFELAALQSGERVLDLGSGSGLDTFVASLKVGATGRVVGIDMTTAQLEKASELREAYEQQAISSLRTLTNPTLKGLLRRVIGKIFGDNLIEGYCSEFEARNAAGGAPGAQPAS